MHAYIHVCVYVCVYNQVEKICMGPYSGAFLSNGQRCLTCQKCQKRSYCLVVVAIRDTTFFMIYFAFGIF